MITAPGMTAPRGYRPQGGFSYIEVMLAVLLLAVCLVPAMNALRVGIAAPLVAQGNAQGLLCVKSQMEKVLAEPYRNLLAAAGSLSTPSASYSLAADAKCPVRNAYIARYNPFATSKFPAVDTGLLYVTVAAPDQSTTPPGVSFTFSTLVSR